MLQEKINKSTMHRIQLYILIALLLVLSWLVLPVSLAILTAYFAQPLLKYLNSTLKLPRWLAALTAEVIILSIFIATILFLISVLIETLPEIKRIISQIELFSEVQSVLLINLQEKFISLLDMIMTTIVSVVQSAFHNLIDFTFYLVALYFSLYETSRNRLWFFIYLPARFKKSIQRVFEEATQLFSYFLSVELRLLLMTFAILSVGLMLLGFSFPVGKALLISVADSLPFLGIGIFLIPMSVYFFATGNVLLCVYLLILYVLIQLTRQFAESYMWASTLHIRSVHAFMISAISLLLFGIAGILISPFLLLIAVKMKKHPIFESK
ncbi:AI-2E family transporter [Viridibacillus sp. YIM B01967]|uniref:AI-2E family transporter n=1 Tax=Viridibacillus soli TaxID=2798301 RepID=A0ABS1H2E8_9BACL|nr:AI-2E family transporter [Viridibacillus soli]MBK3493575.1 AI-2E family transporter [Viridibacillus soli]